MSTFKVIIIALAVVAVAETIGDTIVRCKQKADKPATAN